MGTYFTKYYKDYVYLKTHSPIQIEGELIGYSNSVSPDDLTVAKSWLIIMLKDDDEKVILNIINAEKNWKRIKYLCFYICQILESQKLLKEILIKTTITFNIKGGAE